MVDVVLRRFVPEDQAAVKALILAGLAEHWGTLDPALNPDLDDIATTYRDATFVVACVAGSPADRGDSTAHVAGSGFGARTPDAVREQSGRIAGTGVLVPRGDGTAEIVRMSVAAEFRRQAIGRRILRHLVAEAQAQGFRRLILETTATWSGAIAFYRAAGFHITHYEGGDAYFELPLCRGDPDRPPAD